MKSFFLNLLGGKPIDVQPIDSLYTWPDIAYFSGIPNPLTDNSWHWNPVRAWGVVLVTDGRRFLWLAENACRWDVLEKCEAPEGDRWLRVIDSLLNFDQGRTYSNAVMPKWNEDEESKKCRGCADKKPWEKKECIRCKGLGFSDLINAGKGKICSADWFALKKLNARFFFPDDGAPVIRFQISNGGGWIATAKIQANETEASSGDAVSGLQPQATG